MKYGIHGLQRWWRALELLQASTETPVTPFSLKMTEYGIKWDEEEISAMQEIKVAARRLYHEAPNDVFELFVMLLSDVDKLYIYGRGVEGLNVLRLVSKRCLRVVESVATRLTSDGYVETLPVVVINRCSRIEHIRCRGEVRSLEGCPFGLKSLHIAYGSRVGSLEPLSACKGLETLEIDDAYEIFDLSPLSACKNLKILTMKRSKVTDLSPLSVMTLLEELELSRHHERTYPYAVHKFEPSIKDLTSLSHCNHLQKLSIGGNLGIKDLKALSQCPYLEDSGESLAPPPSSPSQDATSSRRSDHMGLLRILMIYWRGGLI